MLLSYTCLCFVAGSGKTAIEVALGTVETGVVAESVAGFKLTLVAVEIAVDIVAAEARAWLSMSIASGAEACGGDGELSSDSPKGWAVDWQWQVQMWPYQLHQQ